MAPELYHRQQESNEKGSDNRTAYQGEPAKLLWL